MRRPPNPWVVVPVALATLGGGTVGFFVTRASCAPDPCIVPAALVATGVGLTAAVGVGVVVVLALKSLDEYRSHLDREIVTLVEQPTTADGGDTSSSLLITEADERHLEAISRFLGRVREEAGGDPPGWIGASGETLARLIDGAALESHLGEPDRRTFIAVRPEGAVGLAVTHRLEAGHAELAAIVVLPSMIGRGIGTPLLELAVSTLGGEGIRTVVVTTETENRRARRFFEGRGFVETGRRTLPVGNRDLEVVDMERRL